jgi:hypothetical protein
VSLSESHSCMSRTGTGIAFYRTADNSRIRRGLVPCNFGRSRTCFYFTELSVISFCDRHMECLLCLLEHADPQVKANSANSANSGSTIMELSEDLLPRLSTRINLLRKEIPCVFRLEDILRHCRSSFELFRLLACPWRIHSAKTTRSRD